MEIGLYRWNPHVVPNTTKGHTEGRLPMDATIAAYIAGFLDGDGSIHIQLIQQQEYKYGFYVRMSISFHQHETGIEGLRWLKDKLKVGYLRKRTGDMCDYVITSRPAIRNILNEIAPYIVFKRRQVVEALKILNQIEKISGLESFLLVARQLDAFATLNRSRRRTNTSKTVLKVWNDMGRHTPVTTDPVKVR